MDYNEENLKLVTNVIRNNLTSDLLPKKWIERNRFNPTFGHCHTASACLQQIFGSKILRLHRGLDDEGIWHWWAVDKEGVIIDITHEQYTSRNKKPPYHVGEKASMLGFDYRKRVFKLLDKVTKELSSNGTPPL